jgi:hypothetical protein
MEPARTFPRVDTSEMRRFVGFVGSNEVRPRPKGRPLLWTFTDSHPGDAYLTDVWLQHGYATPLKRVVVEAEGSPRHTVYEDMQPGEAVKVDEVHMIYDSDFVLTVEVTVEREGEEPVGFVLGGRKGRIPDQVLVRAPLGEDGA